VFGRGSDFDPATDPIVRMQAGRVRRSLERYYLTAGANDPLLISLPKGTYVPQFQLRETAQLAAASPARTGTPSVEGDAWPKLLLMPFRNLTQDPALDNIARGLVVELAGELNNYQEMRFLLGASEEDPRNREAGAQYEVRGTVAESGEGLKISVQLLSGSPSGLVWAHTYPANRTGPALNAFLDELARTLAATIAGERGLVARHIAQGARRREMVVPGAYEAILRYHQFAQSPSPEAYRAALTALQTAVKDYPDCGCCWSFLARLLAEDYALWASGNAGLIQDALSCARKGVQLAPLDQRARSILGYVYLLNDQVEKARQEAEAALALNPNSLLIMGGIGYLLTLCGDWERGPELSRKAIRLNPFHLPVVHTGLWLDAFRRKDFEEAYWQSLEFSPPEIFWHPLLQAVALAFLGRREEAAASARQILKLKPDFLERSHWLITRYVKFDDLVERIDDGLTKAGLRVKRARLAARARSAGAGLTRSFQI
jgi:adenylate cyclase